MPLKQCTRCKVTRGLSEFNKRESSQDRLYPQCKTCTKELSAEYRKKNPDAMKEWRDKNKKHVKEYDKKYREENKLIIADKKAIYDKEYRKENKIRIAKSSQIIRLRNIDKKAAYDRKYVQENKQLLAEKRAAYYLRNKQKRKEYYDEWYKQNEYKVYANNKKYSNAKRKAAPHWLTQGQIKQMELLYKDRQLIENITGVRYDIDHIVPLGGKAVCGLHVPWNLQILTRAENSAKRNKLIV